MTDDVTSHGMTFGMDSTATSAIEGENLDRDSVRSSLLAHLGKAVANTNVGLKAEGAASLIVDTRRNWDSPLTHDLAALCAMGAMLSRGAGRGTRYDISHSPAAPDKLQSSP